MDELKRLEQVHAVINLMQSHNLITPSSDSDSTRFLANFLLFLIQPSGELDIQRKCSLVSEYLPEIPDALFEQVSSSSLVCQEGFIGTVNTGLQCVPQDFIGSSSTIIVEDTTNSTDLPTEYDEVALVGLDAMQRANTTLEDFLSPSFKELASRVGINSLLYLRSYFMFHTLDVNQPQLIFKYLPVLSFAESYIYQLDTLNEKLLNICNEGIGFSVYQDKMHKVEQGWNTKLTNAFKIDPFRPLAQLLDSHGLLTERIKEELRHGEEYWALERKLCFALKSSKEIMVEDVMKAIHLKSFDYRVLNLLLYGLRGEKVNDLHMDFLSTSEFLVEVSDDLFDYEEDVLENNFNILRMFIKIYGPSKAPAMLAKCIAETEEKYDRLLKTLDPQLSMCYQRRCEEATKEGGETGGYPFGSWSIPPVIVDEELYRVSMLTP